MAVTFPIGAVNGQIAVDAATGNRWQYQSALNSWIKLAPVVDVIKTEQFVPVANQTLFTLAAFPTDPTDVCLHINGAQYFPPFITVSGLNVTWGNLFRIAATDTVRITYT